MGEDTGDTDGKLHTASGDAPYSQPEAEATAGETSADRDESPIRCRGDEPELYLAYNHVLNGLIRRDVGAAPEDVEDACQFAWIQFFRYPPDRDRNWRSWLYRTAQREASRLTAIRVRRSESTPTPAAAVPPKSPPTHATGSTSGSSSYPRCRKLSSLSIRMQQTVIVRSQVRKQIEVAKILGVTTARVSYLLRRASETLDEMATRRAERERPVASRRAARLRELEDNPPKWLMEAIGRAPSRNKTSAYAVLAWRRTALASTTTGATTAGNPTRSPSARNHSILRHGAPTRAERSRTNAA